MSLNSARGFGKHPGKNVMRRSTRFVSERASLCGLVGCAGWVKFFPGTVRPVEANHSLQGRPLGSAATFTRLLCVAAP